MKVNTTLNILIFVAFTVVVIQIISLVLQISNIRNKDAPDDVKKKAILAFIISLFSVLLMLAFFVAMVIAKRKVGPFIRRL